MNFFDNSKINRIFDITNSVLLLSIISILIATNFIIVEDTETETVDENIISTSEVVEENLSSAEEVENITYKIDIKGAVKNPGVYEVEQGAIVNDIIKLAGGTKSTASTQYLNLSKKVTDEMVIVVYTKTEISKMSNPTSETCTATSEDTSSCKESSIIESSDTSSSSSSSSSSSEQTTSKISINTATKEELMTLSGIGEAKAEAIIEYRENNNGFSSIEEIMNVSGIGESAYNKIKDYITI